MNDQSKISIDGKTFAIGVLAVSACILFTGLIMVMIQPEPAYAIGQSVSSGDYIMLTQQLSTDQEGCVIIDAATRQMNVYALDGANRQLKVIHGAIPLSELPGPNNRERRP